MCLELAPFYVEYGNALLTNAQQSTDIFGSAVKEAQKAKAEKEGMWLKYSHLECLFLN